MLVNCVAYKEGLKIKDISKEDIAQNLKDDQCFVWVALKDPEPSEILEMQNQFKLPDLAVEDALHGHQRPKVEEYGDIIFVVLQVFEKNEEGFSRGEVHIFAGPHFVFSIRRNYEKPFTDVRERCEKEPHLLKLGSGFVLYALIDAVVDRYFPFVESLELELEKIEEGLFLTEANAPRKNIEALYSLKQKMITFKHALFPLMESIGKLYGGRVPPICQKTQDYFRDIFDHLYRMNQTLDNVREMLLTAIQVNLSIISLNESENNKRLASWAAIIGVPTMLAGIYGMNFKHMPELEWYYGYPIAISVMLFIDLFLFYKFRKSGWI